MVVSGRALPEQRLDGMVTAIPWVRVLEGFEVQPRSHTLRPLPQALLDSGYNGTRRSPPSALG
jgi:hypothetical protein